MPKKKNSMASGPHVNKGKDKATTKTRTDCSALVSTKATQCAIYQANPPLQDSGGKLIAAGVKVSAADLAVINAKSALHTALGLFDTATIQWDSAYDVYVSNVEVYALKPEDIAALALTALEKGVYVLAEPLGILATYDVKKRLIRIHVQLPPGMTAAEIEISPDPITATSFARIVGKGVKRTVQSPAPGTWWIRAASVRSAEQSAFFGPVSVVVK